MVVYQLSEEATDRLFQALADSTRRDIMRRVTAGESSVSGLAALYAMSFAAVQKHVAVLERASLVTKDKRGREQIVRANHDGLRRARRLLDEYEAIWRERAGRIADLLAEPDSGKTETSKAEDGKGSS
ncbi:ArsR/SmtB family transcription factor [Arthrobacter sp. Soil763]|uniref:ArsR/SmtB family transcription factor n=1 Tax=Arthrobacter sp. Soil763 TaxID=1736402 RepID=UPI0006FFE98D|nr:metalloregulator ArsR/SmtB family transcription factor [Arthrobacter sp. Soil763]KRE79356.1 ArsR family transcriptional regulator [Arthrobacter sp. Soil763]